MSEREIESDFRKIIEGGEQYDIGVELFNQKIAEAEKRIASATEDDAEYEELKVLNDAWQSYGEVATLTGRVYVTEDGIIPPESWGDTWQDKEGLSFYFVEGERVRSMGIVDGMHSQEIDEDGSGYVSSRIAYAFMPVEQEYEDEGIPYFVAYPDELSDHRYDAPTSEAASARLHSGWPDHAKLIDNLVQPGASTLDKLPRRLSAIARKIGADFDGADSFWRLASIYANDRLHLDKERGFMLRVRDGIVCQNEGNQIELVIDGETTLNGHRPWVCFEFNDARSEVRAMVFLGIPDTEEGGETEVGILAENILGLKAAPSAQALIARALQGVREGLTLDAAAAADVMFTESDVTSMRISRPDYHHGSLSEEIKAMQLLERDLIDLIGQAKPVTQKHYLDEEAATEASNRITNMLADRLIGAGIGEFALEFRGENARRPRLIKEVANGEELAEGTYIVQVDRERSMMPLQHGDSFTGEFHAFFGDVEEIKSDGEEGHSIYRPVPTLVVEVNRLVTPLVARLNLPLVEAEVRRRAMIPLDGSVEISIVPLEIYRRSARVRTAAAKQYGRDPITKNIHKLHSAFKRETIDGFQELNVVNRLNYIARRIMLNNLRGGVSSAIESLEVILTPRQLKMQGIAYDSAGNIVEEEYVEGVAVDVRTDIPGSEIQGLFLAVVQPAGQYWYVPLATVKGLAF